ncbi:NAD-binding protein [Fomitopsis schrenkii]|uniref:NAD-binding protein n=1 Tax=Fomitopsis schrenkii TaxID=2126942 RepID=S8FEM8_FOMSC|nr:NAD-binding protein [Fomitopsis schrenkii]
MAETSSRVAIVTGAAQGIGLSIALRLADDGLDVAVNDITQKTSKIDEVVAQVRAKGRRSLALPGDVSNENDVKTMVARVVEEFGGIDVLVANAGIALHRSFLETSTEEWDRVVSINLKGVMLCYRYAAIQMVKQGRGGRIIGASSQAGRIGTTSLAAYSATKFAVRGLTQTVALELASHKITVNAYAPGFILTDLAYHPDDAKNGGKLGSTIKKMFGLAPDAPEAGPETVASMVSYLASPEAHFVTGQTILVNGGSLMD